MSKAVNANGNPPQPGDRNPNDSKQVLVVCPACDELRWIKPSNAPLKLQLEAADYRKPCRKCSAKQLAEQRPESRRGRLKTERRHLLCGTVQLLGGRQPEHYQNGTAPSVCGICAAEFDAKKAFNEKQVVFCDGCEPWVAVALTHQQCNAPGPERDEAYARIKSVRARMAGDDSKVPVGPKMPFWLLVKRFVEVYPAAAPESRSRADYGSSQVRHLALFFRDTPIGKIDSESADEFKEYFLRGDNRLGPRHATSARRILETLRRLLRFAKEEGWIKSNPLPNGVALGPAIPLYKGDRILSLEEEKWLHAACEGQLAYLLAVSVYMADAPGHLRDFLKLRWADVNFEKGLIPGHKSLVQMTPRLSEAMRLLRAHSAPKPESLVVTRSLDRCREDLRKAFAAAGLVGLKLTDIRRTGAWRLHEAHWPFTEIAARLGMTHLDNVCELLKVNEAAAQQEAGSPLFQEFISKQIGYIQNGNGQKNGGAEKLKKGAPVAIQDASGFAAIDALVPSVSINKLAKYLNKSRGAVRAWVERCGFNSLEELVAARQQKRGGNKSN